MGALLELLFGGGLTTKIAMVALAAGFALSTFGYVHKTGELVLAEHKNTTLEKQVQQLTADNTQLKANVDTITKVNQVNVETNNKLLAERKDAQAAISNLAKQKQVTSQKLDEANKKIDEMLKDPKNDGPVAPVLRETIRSIEEKK